MMNDKNNPFTDHVKDHFKHAVEYSKDLMNTVHEVNAQMVQKVTDICAHNMSHGKDFLECKSFHDVVDWCHGFVNSNINHMVDGASKAYTKTCEKVSKANSDITKKASENFEKMKDNFHK